MDENAVLDRLRRARDRDAVVGLRQLRHALPRLPLAGRRSRPCRSGSTTRRSSTGSPAAARRVALHIPWDRVDDYGELRALRRGAGHPHRRDQPEPLRRRRRTGSAASAIPTRGVRAKALDHCRECIEIAREVGSTSISLWLADGTNYPGQDDLRGRHARLARRARADLRVAPAGMRLLVEYKFFEPAFYSTDLPDWGTAALLCRRLGPQAQVLVDTGHHPQGTNVEQIVARAARRGPARRLPLQQPQVRRRRPDRRLDRPVRALPDHARDRARRTRERRRVHDRPVAQRRGQDRRDDPVGDEHPDRVREGAARRRGSGSRRRRREGDVLGAHRILLEAFETDVRPLLGRLRGELGVEADPVEAFRARRLRRARSPRERGTASVESAYEQRDLSRDRCASPSSSPASATRSSPRPGARRSQVLERLGHEVVFPAEQTCCGQMHLNSGYRDEAPRLGAPVRRDLRRVRGRRLAVVVVRRDGARALPCSASCDERLRAVGAARRSGSASTDVGASFPHRVTYHPTCHSLRVTRVGDAPLRLLAHVRGLELVELPRAEECCGFGGTFAVKNADTSSAMLADKCDAIEATGAESAPPSTARACCRSAAASRGGGSPRARRPPRRDPRVDDDRRFPDAARRELANTQLRANLRNATDTIRAKRARVVAELPDWEELREAGRAIKADVLAHLDDYLLQFEAAVEAAGGHVHWARDAAEANAIVVGRRARARRRRGREGQVADDRRDRAQRRARRGGHPRARDRLRRADPAARRRLVVAHPRPGDPPQPHRDPRPLRAHDRARHRPPTTRATSPRPRALYLRERFLAREGRRQRRELRRRRDGHGLRRRVRGQRPHVHDAAAGARHRPRDREARCRASPTSRSSCSCCRARRPASG